MQQEAGPLSPLPKQQEMQQQNLQPQGAPAVAALVTGQQPTVVNMAAQDKTVGGLAATISNWKAEGSGAAKRLRVTIQDIRECAMRMPKPESINFRAAVVYDRFKVENNRCVSKAFLFCC